MNQSSTNHLPAECPVWWTDHRAISDVDFHSTDLLSLLADPEHPVGRDVAALFLSACEHDAATHDGTVSVNRVRALLVDEDIPARRYSSLWSHYTGRGKPMVKIPGVWEVCDGSESRNDGRPLAVRRWVGESA